MTGRIDIFIPRTADGDLMTGPVPKHRLPKVRSIDVRTFFDPLADRNLPNAIPAPKAKPMPRFAPKCWRLAPEVEVAAIPQAQVPAAHCGRRFRTPSGFAWHMTNVHPTPV